MLTRNVIALMLGAGALAGVAWAAAPPELAIENRQFTPQELTLPAGTKVELVIRNRDALPAEFESYDLSREVVVPGQAEVRVYVGPLAPGRYRFFNDFNPSAQGWIVVPPAPPQGG